MKSSTKYDCEDPKLGFSIGELKEIVVKHPADSRVKCTKTKGLSQFVTQIEVVEGYLE